MTSRTPEGVAPRWAVRIRGRGLVTHFHGKPITDWDVALRIVATLETLGMVGEIEERRDTVEHRTTGDFHG